MNQKNSFELKSPSASTDLNWSTLKYTKIRKESSLLERLQFIYNKSLHHTLSNTL